PTHSRVALLLAAPPSRDDSAFPSRMGLGEETFSRGDMCDDAVHDLCVLSGVIGNHPASCPAEKEGGLGRPPLPGTDPLLLLSPGPSCARRSCGKLSSQLRSSQACAFLQPPSQHSAAFQ